MRFVGLAARRRLHDQRVRSELEMRKLERALFAVNRKCSYGCLYCFATFHQYTAKRHLHALPHSVPEDVDIIYPACDGEFFSDPEAKKALRQLVQHSGKPMFVSISVKSPITENNIAYIRELNDRLISTRRGFVKCSVSVSIKHRLEEIEPRTPKYDARLSAARTLALHGIPRSVNLRPIFPFVTIEEYSEIIGDFAPFTDIFLIGGLYLDEESAFGQSLIENYGQHITQRPVEWLPEHPVWTYCENPEQLHNVEGAIRARQRQAFQSDTEVIQCLSRSLVVHEHAASSSYIAP
jgi:hypothetical protein